MQRVMLKLRDIRLRHQVKVGRPVPIQEVADAMNIDRKALARMEKGQTSRIDFDILAKLCSFFEVTPGDLLEYTDAP